MPDKTKYFAIEIKNPEIAEMAKLIIPALGDLPFEEELKNNFLVFDPDRGYWVLLRAEFMAHRFMVIDNGPRITIKVLTPIRDTMVSDEELAWINGE